MRTAQIQRKTAETDINLFLNLDGGGKSEIETGCGFFDHMLTLFAAHSGFDLNVKCKGDISVDCHHTVEDIGIALGAAFLQAIGTKAGIARYGEKILPMDEALILSAVDISGRGMFCGSFDIKAQSVGSFDTELNEEFWIAFSREAKITLHVKQLSGANAHHIIEGTFKSVARSLSAAAEIDPELNGKIPSTKGVL